MAVAPFTSADNRRPRRHRHGLAGELRPVLGGDLPVASASPRAFLGQIMHPCSGGGEVPWREAVDPGRSSTVRFSCRSRRAFISGTTPLVLAELNL
nr:hypothetical protein SEVIR_6G083100v2 [Setaria viridis]